MAITVTWACNILSFYLLSVNVTPKKVVFVVKRYAVREAKNGGTQYAELNRAARSTQVGRECYLHVRATLNLFSMLSIRMSF